MSVSAGEWNCCCTKTNTHSHASAVCERARIANTDGLVTHLKITQQNGADDRCSVRKYRNCVSASAGCYPTSWFYTSGRLPFDWMPTWMELNEFIKKRMKSFCRFDFPPFILSFLSPTTIGTCSFESRWLLAMDFDKNSTHTQFHTQSHSPFCAHWIQILFRTWNSSIAIENRFKKERKKEETTLTRTALLFVYIWLILFVLCLGVVFVVFVDVVCCLRMIHTSKSISINRNLNIWWWIK